MTDYRVIPYDRSLLPEIAQLWSESGEAHPERRRELFEWFTEGNPHLEGRPPYWCLHDGERVVGMHGHMPVILDVDGKELHAHLAQDDLLSPACRGKGLGKVLLQGVMEQAPDLAGAMWFNEPNHRSYVKAGWSDVPGLYRYVHFLDSSRLAEEAPKAWMGALIRVVGPLALPALRSIVGMARNRRLSLRPIDCFGDDAEALYRRLAPHLGIVVRRTAAYLNWRFVQKPGGAYERVGAYGEDGDLLGWAVHTLDRSEATPSLRIVELMADTEAGGVLETLVLDALASAKRLGATHVVVAASRLDSVHRLRRLGFLKNPREDYHMVIKFEGRIAEDQITDISRWTLNLADADGDVWP